MSQINFITLNPQESDTEPHWGKAIFWKRICESCENYFRSTGVLNNHMLDDTRERQFLITNYIILSTLTCNFCNFLAWYQGQWIYHRNKTKDQSETETKEQCILDVVAATFEPYFKGSWNITCRKTQHQCGVMTGEQNISNVDVGIIVTSLVAKVD